MKCSAGWKAGSTLIVCLRALINKKKGGLAYDDIVI